MSSTMKISIFTTALILIACIANAGNIDGKWEGFPPSHPDIKFTFTFKSDGKKLTGTMIVTGTILSSVRHLGRFRTLSSSLQKRGLPCLKWNVNGEFTLWSHRVASLWFLGNQSVLTARSSIWHMKKKHVSKIWLKESFGYCNRTSYTLPNFYVCAIPFRMPIFWINFSLHVSDFGLWRCRSVPI